MLDYRSEPSNSPLVWCIYCNAPVRSEETVRVMKTVFHAAEGIGLIPCGLCRKHSQAGANGSTTN